MTNANNLYDLYNGLIGNSYNRGAELFNNVHNPLISYEIITFSSFNTSPNLAGMSNAGTNPTPDGIGMTNPRWHA